MKEELKELAVDLPKKWRFWLAIATAVISAVLATGLVAPTSTAGVLLGGTLTIFGLMGIRGVEAYKKVRDRHRPPFPPYDDGKSRRP